MLAQFIALALTWGASFLFIKVGLRGMSAGQVAAGRIFGGALALTVVCLVTRRRLPRERVVWLHLAVVGVFLCVVPFLLFSWAEQHVSSVLASIYNATTPLMTSAVALAALPGERPTRAMTAGLAAGFVGILVVFAPWRGVEGGSSLAAQLALLGATACYGIAFVYLRRFVSPRKLPAIPLATLQVGLAAVLMALLVPVYTGSSIRPSWTVVLSVLALGVLGTGVAYVWNTNIVAAWGATNASTVTYLTPLVGVVLGALLLGEHVTWNEPVGGVIVVAGIAIAQGRFGRRRAQDGSGADQKVRS